MILVRDVVDVADVGHISHVGHYVSTCCLLSRLCNENSYHLTKSSEDFNSKIKLKVVRTFRHVIQATSRHAC